MVSQTWKLQPRKKKVAFIFSSVVGTLTRGDLFHQSDGAVSCGFCAVHQLVHLCLCVVSQEGSPSVTASQMLTLI